MHIHPVGCQTNKLLVSFVITVRIGFESCQVRERTECTCCRTATMISSDTFKIHTYVGYSAESTAIYAESGENRKVSEEAPFPLLSEHLPTFREKLDSYLLFSMTLPFGCNSLLIRSLNITYSCETKHTISAHIP